MDPRYPLAEAEIFAVPIASGSGAAFTTQTFTKEIQIYSAVSHYSAGLTLSADGNAANRFVNFGIIDAAAKNYMMSHTNPVTASQNALLNWYPKLGTDVSWTVALDSARHIQASPVMPVENPNQLLFTVAFAQAADIIAGAHIFMLGWRKRRYVSPLGPV